MPRSKNSCLFSVCAFVPVSWSWWSRRIPTAAIPLLFPAPALFVGLAALTRVGDDEHLLRQLLAGKLVLKKPKLNTCSTRHFLTKTLAAALELLSFTLTKSTAYHHKAIKTKLGTEHFGCG